MHGKTRAAFFNPQNSEVADNLKWFLPDHPNFLDDDEDKVICREKKVEPKYWEQY